MMHMVGDGWLKNVHKLFVEFYPELATTFSSDVQTVPACARLVVTYGTKLPPDALPDVVMPKIHVSGLSSIELIGKTVAGANYLPEIVQPAQMQKLIDVLAEGNVVMHCPDRLSRSLDLMSRQGPIGANLASFIRAEYVKQPLFSGADRPNPALTVRAAQLLASALGLEPRISRDEPWRTDGTAYRRSPQVLLPQDATALGIEGQIDPQWFAALGTVLSRVYSEQGVRKPADEPDDADATKIRMRINELLQPTSAYVAALFHAQKAGDPTEVERMLDVSLENWSKLSPADRSTVLRLVLKWWPEFGRVKEAINLVLSLADSIDAQSARKISGLAMTKMDPTSLAEVIDSVADRPGFGAEEVEKMRRRLALLLKKQQRSQG